MDGSHATGKIVDLRLVAHAAVMTLLGLLSGFTPAFATSPTVALETHTIGVLQGALFFGLAAVWPSLGSEWAVRIARIVRWWVSTRTGSVHSSPPLCGTRGMFIVNGASMPAGAAPWMEVVVAVLLNLSILVIVMCLLILWAVRNKLPT
jgi:hypothetical protein